jgi:hypothetical protein
MNVVLLELPACLLACCIEQHQHSCLSFLSERERERERAELELLLFFFLFSFLC